MNENAILRRDFLIVNGACGLVGLFCLGIRYMQIHGLIPDLPCIFLTIFHIYCPGCGGTRAVFSMLHGHILQSLTYNPAVVLGILLALYYELAVIVTILKNNGRKYYYRKMTLVYLYLVLFFGYAVVRDLLLVCMHVDLLGDILG